jgi:hypothetical protein
LPPNAAAITDMLPRPFFAALTLASFALTLPPLTFRAKRDLAR